MIGNDEIERHRRVVEYLERLIAIPRKNRMMSRELQDHSKRSPAPGFVIDDQDVQALAGGGGALVQGTTLKQGLFQPRGIARFRALFAR